MVVLPFVAWVCLLRCFREVAQKSTGRWLLFLRLRGVVLGRGRIRGFVRWRKWRSMGVVVCMKFGAALAGCGVGGGRGRRVGCVGLGVVPAWLRL